ncbi:MAG: rhamnogalacturonan acetylesterase [bacterium]|nr:rhamnogalacturonan acetylesterase [bacterium]MDI1337027.1 rhamnogalacturonan acetylesterase [Lacunisphaera sp.]
MQTPSTRFLIAASLLLGATALFAQRPEDKPLPPAPPVQAEFKFSLVPGVAPAGYTAVAGDEAYSIEKGCGYDLGTKQSTDTPWFFSVKVPEGNYRCTVTLGDPTGTSNTTIRTESGHINAVDIATASGQFVTRTFYANVRRPQLPPPPQNAPGGSIVHMFLAGEAGARQWDEKLTVEFNGRRPRVTRLAIMKDDTVPTIFTAGDSTVGDPRRGPGGNWPTQLCQFLKPEVAVCNSAEGGETSKSFVTGQRLDKVLSQMKPGDFFLIQFAHNDSKAQWPQTDTEPATTFKAYLGVYLAETKRHGGTLVLVTPMERRSNGDTVGPWARAMREFAAENKVPLIDQWAMSKEMWTALGPDVGTAFADQTHLSGYGGYLLAKNIVRGLKANVPGLAKFIVEDYRDMDPAHPEPPPEYLQQSPGPGGPSPRQPEPGTKN